MNEHKTQIHEAQDVDAFRARLAEMDALPSLPTVVMELLHCVDDEDTTDEKIVGLISQDTGLTARLLKLANSAAMGLRVQVTSIQRAVPLLGRKRVRQICLGGGVWDSLKPLAEQAAFDLDAFERHSLAVAEIAQGLAVKSSKVEEDEVFAAALLHDIGKFLLLAFDGPAYASTLLEAGMKKADLEELEFENIGWTHSRVGGWLAEHWGLPGSVRDTVTLHHQPEVAMNGKNGFLVATVAVANNLSKVIKVGNSGNPKIASIGGLLVPLKLGPADLKEIGEKMKGMA
jgi:putative nucleotidyltransferase with HDIG domain